MNKKVKKLLNKSFAIVGSVADGKPFIKVMSVHKREDENIFVFASNSSALRTKQFRENPNVCLYFYKVFPPPFFKGVMLAGKMEVLDDQKTKSEYWEPSMKIIYKCGEADPDYCILKFVTESGRYYEGLKSEDFKIAKEEK